MEKTTGWLLYAQCEIVYDGRAKSTLENGNYLIMVKSDNSLSIHGSTLIQPRNYMGSGTELETAGNILKFKNKKETVTITISQEIFKKDLEDWSDNKIVIRNTEKELVHKIRDNFNQYINTTEEAIIVLEKQTELGPIDIFASTATTDYVIEVKRRTITIKDITQLKRYMEAMQLGNRTVNGYIAGPSISTNAHKYLTKHGLNYIKVDF